MTTIISNYKEIKRIGLGSFGQPLHQVKDFSTRKSFNFGEENPSPLVKKQLTISGKSFIIDLIGYSHFHFIYDKIAQYEFIKKYHPDTNLYIVANSGYFHEKNGLLDDLKALYLIPDSNILNIDSGERYVFKNLFFLWSTHNVLFKDIFFKDFFDPWSYKKDFKLYIETIYPLLQSRFRDYIKPQVDTNLKIFISRFNQHEEKGRNKNDFRYISRSDEIKLENFFKYKGYQIIVAEDLSLLKQVELYSEAYRVAGLKASGLVNTIFCKKDSGIIAINLDDEYQVWYDYICMFAGLKYTELPAIYNGDGIALSDTVWREVHKRKTFSFKQIEKSLLENLNLL
jgi:hypothetical protein